MGNKLGSIDKTNTYNPQNDQEKKSNSGKNTSSNDIQSFLVKMENKYPNKNYNNFALPKKNTDFWRENLMLLRKKNKGYQDEVMNGKKEVGDQLPKLNGATFAISEHLEKNNDF